MRDEINIENLYNIQTVNKALPKNVKIYMHICKSVRRELISLWKSLLYRILSVCISIYYRDIHIARIIIFCEKKTFSKIFFSFSMFQIYWSVGLLDMKQPLPIVSSLCHIWQLDCLAPIPPRSTCCNQISVLSLTFLISDRFQYEGRGLCSIEHGDKWQFQIQITNKQTHKPTHTHSLHKGIEGKNNIKNINKIYNKI